MEGLKAPGGVGFAIRPELDHADALAAAFELAGEGSPGLG